MNTGKLCCWPRVLRPSLFIYKLLPTMEDPTPIPETLVPRLEGHGIVSEVFVWRPQDAALVDIVFPHGSEDVGAVHKPFSR